MKQLIKKILQSILGFDNYLFYFSLYIIYTLKWNKKEGDFLYFLKLIPNNNEIVLDIGANIGIMTTHLSKKLPNSQIYSFEPVPYNIKALKRIVSFFKLNNVKIFEIALGNENGKVEMVMPVLKSVKMQGLSHVIDESIGKFNQGIKFLAPIKKLDSIEEINKGNRVKAIKIDVENYEYYVLEGGKKIIKRDKPIIYCELWENQNRDKSFSLMKSLDYDIKILNEGKLIEFDKNVHHTQNFFFIPQKIKTFSN